MEIIIRMKVWATDSANDNNCSLENVFEKMKGLLEKLFRIKWSSSSENEAQQKRTGWGTYLSHFPPTSWNSFPIQDKWQSDDQRNVSLLVFNLCVGCNVTNFGGFRTDIYTMTRLRRLSSTSDSILGIQSDGERIIGPLLGKNESLVSSSWSEIKNLLPALPEIDFCSIYTHLTESDWHKKLLNDRKMKGNDANVNEIEALECMVSFSYLCLQTAKHQANQDFKQSLILDALSVLMPMVRGIFILFTTQ